MKGIKKILAVMVAMVMTLGLVATNVSALEDGETPDPAASTTHSLTITHQDGVTDAIDHVYKAYQILTGDLSGTEDSYVLANMKWGANAPSGKNAGNKLTDDEVTAVKAWTAESVKTLEPTGTTTYIATKNTDGDYVFSALPNGYYVIKDETDMGTDTYNDANSAIIVQVVGDTTVETKRAIPTVDKEVYDDEEAAWSDAADHDLYESFQFKLIAAIPADADYAAYPTYKVVFHDTMSVGVAFESIESVKVGNTAIDSTQYTSTGSTSTNSGDAESTWTLTIDNIKPYVTDLSKVTTVEVIYNAHLTNKVTTFYKESNDAATPTNNKVYLEYSNKPGAEGTGKTVEDTVWVFSYEVDNTKVDATSSTPTPLAGAGFKLYKGDTEVSLVYDDEKGAYRPIKTGETGVEMRSANSTGKFNIVGLDVGTYTLKETTTPPGYTTMEDKTIEIKASTVENASGANAKLTMDKADTNNTIENKKGATLPSTGGIGTTIFYVIGSVLVVGAGILLISKKRMFN